MGLGVLKPVLPEPLDGVLVARGLPCHLNVDSFAGVLPQQLTTGIAGVLHADGGELAQRDSHGPPLSHL